MSKLLIAGIGNVLLGDDGIGPFVIKVLEARYDVPENVEFADVGMPALGLPLHLSGADAVILVDSAKLAGRPEISGCSARTRSCGFRRGVASIHTRLL